AGTLPLAYQPPVAWRQLRRLVAYREGLVSRRTAVRNWIDRYLAHETWFDRTGLWSPTGQRRLRARLEGLPHTDRGILTERLDELAGREGQLGVALKGLLAAGRRWRLRQARGHQARQAGRLRRGRPAPQGCGVVRPAPGAVAGAEARAGWAAGLRQEPPEP